jgi:hypothetical protein
MVPLEHQLAALHPADAIKVGQRILYPHRPTGIARDEQQIIIPPYALPGFKYLPVMVAPVIPEAVHSFSRPAFEVHVSDREYSHSLRVPAIPY